MRDSIPVMMRWRRTPSLGYYSATERRIERREASVVAKDEGTNCWLNVRYMVRVACRRL